MSQALPHSVTLSNQHGATAVVSEYGAQVLSWKPAPSGKEVLFLSKLIKTVPEPGSAIRGGIPILFPQFGGYGTVKRQHGFARNFAWELVNKSESDRGIVTFRLSSSDITKLIWPHDFELHFQIELGASDIHLQFSVHNPGNESIQFTSGLHDYFAIQDVSKTSVHGLSEHTYLDNLTKQVHTETAESVTFSQEIDRIYHAKGDRKAILLKFPSGEIKIYSSGFEEAVIWNPWQSGASAIADLEDEDYNKFVCVESVCVTDAVTLEPGNTWRASQTLVANIR